MKFNCTSRDCKIISLYIIKIIILFYFCWTLFLSPMDLTFFSNRCFYYHVGRKAAIALQAHSIHVHFEFVRAKIIQNLTKTTFPQTLSDQTFNRSSGPTKCSVVLTFCASLLRRRWTHSGSLKVFYIQQKRKKKNQTCV